MRGVCFPFPLAKEFGKHIILLSMVLHFLSCISRVCSELATGLPTRKPKTVGNHIICEYDRDGWVECLVLKVSACLEPAHEDSASPCVKPDARGKYRKYRNGKGNYTCPEIWNSKKTIRLDGMPTELKNMCQHSFHAIRCGMVVAWTLGPLRFVRERILRFTCSCQVKCSELFFSRLLFWPWNPLFWRSEARDEKLNTICAMVTTMNGKQQKAAEKRLN